MNYANGFAGNKLVDKLILYCGEHQKWDELFNNDHRVPEAKLECIHYKHDEAKYKGICNIDFKSIPFWFGFQMSFWIPLANWFPIAIDYCSSAS